MRNVHATADCQRWAAEPLSRCVTDAHFMHTQCEASCNAVGMLPSPPPTVLDERRYDQRALIDQIQAILGSELGAHRLVVSNPRFKNYYNRKAARDDSSKEPPRWGEMHADYYESAAFVFSAILFLGEEAVDRERLVGGEFGWVDGLDHRPDGTVHLSAGTVVEPRRGRLVLFSGSGENYHAPLPLLQGRRTSLQMWFTCDC
jgi:hypothetical protein